jgi:hypothetical protein
MVRRGSFNPARCLALYRRIAHSRAYSISSACLEIAFMSSHKAPLAPS